MNDSDRPDPRVEAPRATHDDPAAPDARERVLDCAARLLEESLHGLVTLPPVRRDVRWNEEFAGVAFDALLDGLVKAQSAEGGACD